MADSIERVGPPPRQLGPLTLSNHYVVLPLLDNIFIILSSLKKVNLALTWAPTTNPI